ncbi:hypothetical protein HDV63DRAFT_162475 [Trichoderma sp. SZMC 28014]
MFSKPKVSTPSKKVDVVQPRKELILTEKLEGKVNEAIINMANDLPLEDTKQAIEAIITNVFYMLSIKPNDYPKCFEAAVEKAMTTSFLKAKNWSEWTGCKDLSAKMVTSVQLMRKTGLYHCPSAPAVVVAMALLKVKGIKPRANGALHNMMNQYHVYDNVLTAIHNYAKFPDRIICLDIDFDRDNDKGELGDAITIADDSDIEMPSPTMDVHHSTSANYFKLLRDIRMLEADLDKVTPEDLKEVTTYTIREDHKITREQTEEKFADILKVILEGSYPDKKLLENVTIQDMKVMTRINKTLILHWAVAVNNQTVANWANQITQDLTEYTWTITIEKELPEMFSNDPTKDIWNSIHKWAQSNADSEVIPLLILLKKAFRAEREHGVNAQINSTLNTLSKKIGKLTRTCTKQNKALEEGMTDLSINVQNLEWQIDMMLADEDVVTDKDEPVTEQHK